ncbi:hypothetical protein M404DRAFT_34961 [Pisolithus tinctorius Marx 270]|uniref:Uncharacterized protein n=1 Tax=Pisolithus tinctorius Marx 270 TaxID=870435 RepID=A0A0C3NGC9_PISTI|nr:hypothetical protein M404DRAFT_34961 [Pisolithus tinctorius Marx 270]
MSTNCAPCLSQLVCAATPDPVEAEKAALKAKFIAASVALVAKAKCILDDREDLWEEKGEVFLLVEHGRELNVDTKIDMADGLVVVEAEEAYEQWVVEEITWLKVDKDVWMEEEALQGIEGQGVSAAVLVAMERMLHVEVPQPVHKWSWQAVAEGDDVDKLKISIPPGLVLHMVPCTQCTVKGMPCIRPSGKTCNGCEKSNKGVGKKVQARASVVQLTKAPKASPSKWAHDDNDDDDDMEVVETHVHSKGKVPVHGRFDGKTTSDIFQALGMVRAKAMATHAANLCLQVHIEQLLEALAKLGVE